MSVKKLTFGLQPENKAFRVSSMAGIIVDALLEARGKEISDTYFTQIAETANKGVVSLMNEKAGNTLIIDRQNVALTKSAYPNGHVKLDESFAEFKVIWGIIQKVVKFKEIRRIGIVAEHRFDVAQNNNIELIGALTKLPSCNSPANFTLHYESRIPAKSGAIIDTAKGGFTNFIYDYYDSSLDTSVPEEGKINANFDYQQYYSPSLDTRIVEEMEAHFYAFKKEQAIFEGELVRLGLRK